MGWVIGTKNRILWQPSYHVGCLWLEQIKSLEHLIDAKSGVVDLGTNEIEIDPEIFRIFINTLIKKLAVTNNGPLYAMAAGCLEVSLVIGANIFGTWPAIPPRLEPLLQNAKLIMTANWRFGDMDVSSEELARRQGTPEDQSEWTIYRNGE